MDRAEILSRDARLLDLWERAVGLDRWRREDALLAGAHPAPRALGRRNAALLELRTACFGRAWPLRSLCPACSAGCEFEADSLTLSAQLAESGGEAAARLDWKGKPVALRAPTIDDLIAAADAPDAASAILARCISGAVDPAGLSEAEIEELGGLLERLDAGAAVGFDLDCPACGYRWSAMVDVGDALWTELRSAAERLLLEIHALARAYGWTENEVMRLSPARRAAYLQLVEAA